MPTLNFIKKFLLILFFIAAPALAQDAVPDTRVLSSTAKEIYGNAQNVKIRIGNGGAGPTGILRALSEDYLQMSGKKYGIAWYQDISINTLKQLKRGTIDIALVYEKIQADEAEKEGWAGHRTAVFNDHFLIVGPKNNPAGLDENDSAQSAFTKIAALGEKTLGEKKLEEKKQGKKKPQLVFLSRADNSGTNVKEQSIWMTANLKPWTGETSWYLKYPAFPKDALLNANRKGLYTITDRGTWLSSRNELQDSEIFISKGPNLLNPCFAMLGTKPSTEVLAFLKYLKSPRAQNLISNFGKEKYEGQALFTAAKQID